MNYLLYISLFTLSYIAILEKEYRTVGDAVWMIVSICLTFLFASPIVKEQGMYRSLKFRKNKESTKEVRIQVFSEPEFHKSDNIMVG